MKSQPPLGRVAMLSTHGYFDPVPQLGRTDTGGQVTYVIELSLALARRGVRVDIFTRWFDPERLPPKRLDVSLASEGRRYPSDDIPWEEEVVPVDPSLEVDVFADFARAIRRGVAPAVRPEEALAVMRLIERCRRGAGAVFDMRGKR